MAKNEFFFVICLGIQISPAFTQLYCPKISNITGRQSYFRCAGTCCGSTYTEYCCSDDSYIGAVVGGIVGSIVVSISVMFIVCCLCKRANRQNTTVLTTTTAAGGSQHQQTTSVSMVGGYQQQPVISGLNTHQSGYNPAYGGYSHTTAFPHPSQGAPTHAFGGYSTVPPPAQYNADPAYPTKT